MESASHQPPPSRDFASHRTREDPPLTDSFLSVPPEEKAIHWPSEEKKKPALAPSVPAKGSTSKLVIDLR
jgi:hypothetical protein